jgi:asparagine synthase (glutamine-hydrolysing)
VCGIAGFLDPRAGLSGPDLEARAAAMADRLAHRGPDDRGTWADPAAGIALAHRRLSIVDLSPAGRQPMASADGRWTISFNGEVYNFRELRAELEAAGRRFRGGSDTEVMLEAVSAWGLEPAVRRFVGMFAFALWDRETRTLRLVRDRIGVKPLVYGRAGSAFVFGSELGALEAHPAFHGEVDREALAGYVRYDYIEGPRTIFRAARKLPPGTMLSVRADGTPGEPEPYWSLAEVAARGVASPFRGSEAEAADRLEALLGESVRLQMIADVPLGAWLSGGVDSSLVVALMQERSPRPVRTFTIGFGEPAYDEREPARAVARRLGTEHVEHALTPAEALRVVPDLPALCDEPLGDVSLLPTLLVSRLARRSVTVTLSGEGGDELFGGYGRYAWAAQAACLSRFLPGPARRGLAAAVRAVPPSVWERVASALRAVAPGRVPAQDAGEKAHRFAALLAAPTREALYGEMVGRGTDPAALVSGGGGAPLRALARVSPAAAGSFPRWMMAVDALSWLPDDVLAKADRASMRVALEARVPLLDHRVIEFAWTLPDAMLFGAPGRKGILRRLLARRVSPDVAVRPKQGFTAPIGAWLRTRPGWPARGTGTRGRCAPSGRSTAPAGGITASGSGTSRSSRRGWTGVEQPAPDEAGVRGRPGRRVVSARRAVLDDRASPILRPVRVAGVRGRPGARAGRRAGRRGAAGTRREPVQSSSSRPAGRAAPVPGDAPADRTRERAPAQAGGRGRRTLRPAAVNGRAVSLRPPAPEWLLGAPVHPLTLRGAVDLCGRMILARRPGYVCAANVHVITTSVFDPALRRALRGAAAVVPDGMPLVWFLRSRGHRRQDRVYGPDLMLRMLALARVRRWRVALFGGAPDVLRRLEATLRRRFPGLRIAAAIAPPFRASFRRAELAGHVRAIRRARPDLLFVGLGAPKQEKWMARCAVRTGAPVTIGVGAAFDFIVGRVPQAPHWMRKAGLEWLFRLAAEPRRLWRRYLLLNPLFIALVALQGSGILNLNPGRSSGRREA